MARKIADHTWKMSLPKYVCKKEFSTRLKIICPVLYHSFVRILWLSWMQVNVMFEMWIFSHTSWYNLKESNIYIYISHTCFFIHSSLFCLLVWTSCLIIQEIPAHLKIVQKFQHFPCMATFQRVGNEPSSLFIYMCQLYFAQDFSLLYLKKNFLFKSFWTYSMRIGFLQISTIFSSLCWWFPAAGLGAQMYSDSFFCQLPDMLFGKYFTNIFKSLPKERLKLQQFLVTNVWNS